MSDINNLMGEIDAIVQNSGKVKKLVSNTTRHVEIEVDKANSSPGALCGKLFITSELRYMDGSVDRVVYQSNEFHFADNQLIIEKYDVNKPISKKVMKQINDTIRGISSISGEESKAKFKIDEPTAIGYKGSPKILVICESAHNRDVEKLISEMLFTGDANSHVDTGAWTGITDDEKNLKWAFLEIERRVCNREAVIVSGRFDDWYDLMPLAVISQLCKAEMVIGRSPGKALSVGKVIDINVVFEHFLSQPNSLSHLYNDPYSAIEYFKNIDQTINSLVIFPSILHKFLSER